MQTFPIIFMSLKLSNCFVRSRILHLNAFLGWTCIFNSYNLIVPNSIFKIIKESYVNNFLVCF